MSTAQLSTTSPLAFDYFNAPVKVLRKPGHGTMECEFEEEGGPKMRVGGKTLKLVQFHFHTPSEHALNGTRQAMEAHLVHRDEDGKLLVVGVLMRADPTVLPNAALRAALRAAPTGEGESRISVNAAALLPSQRSFFEYEGSLTTPPCSEAVSWYVFQQPLSIPPSQVLLFQTYVGDFGDFKQLALNARALQPLNDRSVVLRAANFNPVVHV